MYRKHLCALLWLAVLSSAPLLAQQGDADAGAEMGAEVNAAADQQVEPETQQRQTDSLGGMVLSGGTLNVLFFSVLGLFSLWAATVIFERMVHLRRDRLLPQALESQLAELFDSPHAGPSKLQRLCEVNDVAASRILKAGLVRAGRPVPEVEKAMEDAAAREMALLRAKSRPLGVVGSVAPLVGLLGTVVGMIMAFQISSQEGLGKAERLAEGIYLALMTTAAGLTIAIPCLLFASLFQARAERYMCDISECLSATLPSFARMEGKTAAVDGQEIGQPIDHELTARERFLREGVTGSAAE